jgi:predicted anti-sigma-YlaC factor YlaD
MTNPQIDPSRPRPLQTVASGVAKVVGMLTALVTAAAGYGIVTAVQGDAVTGLLGALPGIVTLIGTVAAAFQVANKGEPKVTPMSDPQASNGQRLVADSSGMSPR